MYLYTDSRISGLPNEALICPPLQIPRDAIDSRIDVFAQRALLRMLKADLSAQADAQEMLCAIKTGRLAGIYKEDEQVPALRAQKMGMGWWEVIPNGEDAVLFVERPSAPTSRPIIVFQDSIRSTSERLDPALRRAWAVFIRFERGDIQVCSALKPNGQAATFISTGSTAPSLLKNIAPVGMFCQIAAPPLIPARTRSS